MIELFNRVVQITNVHKGQVRALNLHFFANCYERSGKEILTDLLNFCLWFLISYFVSFGKQNYNIVTCEHFWNDTISSLKEEELKEYPD